MTLPNAVEIPGDLHIVGTGIERAVQLANRTVQSESSAVTINPERVVRATVKIVKHRPTSTCLTPKPHICVVPVLWVLVPFPPPGPCSVGLGGAGGLGGTKGDTTAELGAMVGSP